MATTIITTGDPVTTWQYGLRLPDGRELWADGKILVNDKLEVSPETGKLRELRTGSFANINLMALQRTPKDEAARQFKSSEVQDLRARIKNLANSWGIDPDQYAGDLRVMRRRVTIVLQDAEEHPLPAKDWEEQWKAARETAKAETAAAVNGTDDEGGAA